MILTNIFKNRKADEEIDAKIAAYEIARSVQQSPEGSGMSDTEYYNRIDGALNLRNEYQKKIEDASANRQGVLANVMSALAKDKKVDVSNSLYNPQRKIGTGQDILSSFSVLEDFGEAQMGIQMLRGLDIMDVIIEYPTMLALKGGAEIDTGDGKLNEQITEKLEEFEYKKTLSDFVKYKKISSFGACLVAKTDTIKFNLETPVVEAEKITGFNVIPDYSFFYINGQNLYDVWSDGYGKPREFWIGNEHADDSRFFSWHRWLR